MTSHPQDKADKSIRLPEKGVGFVTIAKGICYNDKKDLLHQDGCMGGVQVLQQKVDISGCRRWNRKNNEVVKETLHICSTIIILLPSGCEPRARKYLIESVTQARREGEMSLQCQGVYPLKNSFVAIQRTNNSTRPLNLQKTFFAVRLLQDGLRVLHVSYDVLCRLRYGTCGAWWYVARMR